MNPSVTPKPLKIGSQIRIVASARKISAEELRAAVEILKGWGCQVSFGKHLHHAYHQFAGTDADRLADLQEALDDPQVEAILFARGGYGTVRIIDNLRWDGFLRYPKWLIGYSDITVLHSHLHTIGSASIHATMPINMGTNTSEAIASLHDALFDETLRYEFPAHALNRTGVMRAPVVGGNLSILANLTGTASQLDSAGKILFLEDLDEYLYHLDRMMTQLKRSGQLRSIAGLIVGGMTDMKDNAVPFGTTAENIIADSVSEYNYPVCFGFPSGHIADNRAIRLGITAECVIKATHVVYHQPSKLTV